MGEAPMLLAPQLLSNACHKDWLMVTMLTGFGSRSKGLSLHGACGCVCSCRGLHVINC